MPQELEIRVGDEVIKLNLPRDLDPRTMHPDLAESLGIPTYRQTGSLGDFYMRRGHLLVDGWRQYDESRRREAEQLREELRVIKNRILKYTTKVGEFLKYVFRR